MIKKLKILLLFFLLIFVAFISFCIYYYKFVEKKIISKFEGQLWETPARVYSLKESLDPETKITEEETKDLLDSSVLVTSFFGSNKQERRLSKLGDFPPHLLYAIICAEDRRFLTHKGVDPKSILRALLTDILHGKFKEGASTITQQLVKNLFLTHERSLIRKFNEAIMAFVLENNYSKDKILEVYINEIYMGQKGAVEVRGIGMAANYYFEKDPKELSIAESALLAGIISSPGRFSPFKNRENALFKQKQVLRKMLNENTITRNEYFAALNQKLSFSNKKHSMVLNKAPFFVDHLKHELSQTLNFEEIKLKDFSIFSTLDVSMQKHARASIDTHLAKLELEYPWLSKKARGPSYKDDSDLDTPMNIEAALIAIDPNTGHIKASIGGRNYAKSNFNRVIFGKRQPGSIFKPFVFLTCFNDKRGIQTVTPKTKVLNTPITIEYEGQSWAPKNYDKEFGGPVNIYRIIAKSINIPTVRVAKHIGFEKVYKTAETVGFNPPPYKIPSIALGTIEASMLEVARAYMVLASGGFFINPTTILKIADKDGKLIYKPDNLKKSIVTKESAFMVSHLLKYNIKIGTAKLADLKGLSLGFYGKTGTSSNYHDAWFAGYSQNLVVIVWVGFDKTKDLGISGAVAALPIWIDFMSKIYKNKLPDEIKPPENITFSKIELFDELIEVPFIKGTDHLNPPTIF